MTLKCGFLTAPKLLMMISCTHFLILNMTIRISASDIQWWSLSITYIHASSISFWIWTLSSSVLFQHELTSPLGTTFWISGTNSSLPGSYYCWLHPRDIALWASSYSITYKCYCCSYIHSPFPTCLAPPKCSAVVPFQALDHPSNLFSPTNLLGIFQMIICSIWIHFKGAIITHFEMVSADFSSHLDKGSDKLHTFHFPVYYTISRYTIRLIFNVVSLRKSSTFGASW